MSKVYRLVWLAFIITIGIFIARNIYSAVSANLAMIALWHQIATPEDRMFTIKIDATQASSIQNGIEKAYRHRTKNALSSYHQAQLSFWSEDLDETVRILEQNQDASISPLSDFLLGFALWRLGDISSASQVWGQINNSEEIFRQWALVAESEQSYNMMELGYKQLLAIDSQDISAQAGYWYAHCNILLVQDSSNREIADCIHNAYQYNSEDYPRLLSLGKSLVLDKYYNLASTILEQAAVLEGDKAHWARYYLGLAYYYQKQYDLAEFTLSRVIQLSPDFARGYHWLARTMVKLGRLEEAYSNYAAALGLLPEDEALLQEYQKFQIDLQK